MSSQNIVDITFDESKFTASQKVILAGLMDVYEAAKRIQEMKPKINAVEGFGDLKKAGEEMEQINKDVAASVTNLNKTLKDQQAQAAATAPEIRKVGQAQKEGTDQVKAATRTMDDYAGALRRNTLEQVKIKQSLDANKEAQKQLRAEIKASGEATENQLQTLASMKEEEIQLAEANKALSITIRNQTKEFSSSAGSIDEFQARVNLLQQAYEKLSEEERASPFGQEMKAQIDALEPKVKGLEGTIGKFGRNVGNYSGALKILENEFKQLPAQIDKATKQFGANSAEVEILKKQYGLLGSIVDNQATGFANMNQEIKANQVALQQLEAAGLKDTEMYQNLFKTTVDLKDQFNDLKEELKFTSDNVSGLDKLVNNLKQLTAVYQIAEGASALFGLENDDLQKSMVRLTAVTNIANGVFQLSEELKRKGSLASIVAANAEKIWMFIKTGSTKATVANTVAEQANTAATEAGAVATEGQAVATEVATVATNSSTLATKALGVAMRALPVGILLLLLPLIANGMGMFSDSAEEAAEKQKKLADATKATNDAILAQNEALDQAQKEGLTALQSEISLREKAGVTAVQAAANRKTLAEQEKQNANDQLKNLSLTEAKISELGFAIQQSDNILAKLNQAKERTLKKDADNSTKTIDSFIAAEQAKRDAAAATYQKGVALLAQRTAAEQRSAETSAEIAKMSADDQNKIALETARIRANTVIDANNRIISNEKYSIEERLAAMKAVSGQQKAIQLAELNSVLSDTTKSDAEKLLAQKNYNYQVNKIDQDGREQRRKAREDYEKRQMAAQFQIQKADIELQAKSYKEIADNEKAGQSARIISLRQYMLLESSIITAERDLQLKEERLTPLEREKIKKDAQVKLISLEQDTEKAITAIRKKGEDDRKEAEKTAKEKRLADAESSVGDRVLRNETLQNAELNRLNEQFLNGELKSVDDFQKKKAAIIKSYNDKNFDEQIKSLEKILQSENLTAEKRAEIDNKLSKLKVERSEQTTEKQISDQQRLRDAQAQLVSEIANLIESSIIGGYEREKNALAEKQRASDENYAREIENIKNSSLTEQQKADQTKLLEAEQAANTKKYENQQKEIDMRRARFERAMAIARVIQNTAAAITAALTSVPPNVPLSIVMGAIGAVQVASILAKPIPAYAEGAGIPGRPDHKGGIALIGERKDGIQERVDLPDGRSFFTDGPMYANLPAGTKVIPLTGEYIDDAVNRTMIRNTAYQVSLMDGRNRQDSNAQLMSMMRWQTGRLEQALAKNTAGSVKVEVKHNPEFKIYIDENVRGLRK